jgi:hypothetical protein
MWMSPHFLFRYALPTAGITASEWLTSIAIAAVATIFLFVTFPLIHAYRKAKEADPTSCTRSPTAPRHVAQQSKTDYETGMSVIRG